MRDRLPEKDWKILRKLNDVALDRFCERVLAEVRTLVDDESKTNHKRYGTLYGLIQDRDKQMARAFDGFSRSKAVEQFALIRAHGLLTTEELADVSPETRESIERLAEFFGRKS